VIFGHSVCIRDSARENADEQAISSFLERHYGVRWLMLLVQRDASDDYGCAAVPAGRPESR
jgi:hypothetical protein